MALRHRPEHVGALLGEYGWTERGQVGRADYLTRYVESAGRHLSIMDIERFVAADKP